MPRLSPIDRARSRRLAVVLCLTGSACAVRPSEIPAYPLYPNPERHLDASKVAKLVALTDAPVAGTILKFVDRQSVTDQATRAFELLPGCHVVQTENRLVTTNGGLFRGNAARVFALRMKPGRTYVVRLNIVEGGMSGIVRILLRAEERDRSGATTATFDPVQDVDEVKACLAWHAEAAASP